MWQLLVLSLVLFDTGYSYPRLETKNEDVYEVIEDKSTNSLKFVNPESARPVLREITYYHLVEKPYGDDKENVKSSDDNRLATNGHGYQYINISSDTADIEKVPEDSNIIDHLLIEPEYDDGDVREPSEDIVASETQSKPANPESEEIVEQKTSEQSSGVSSVTDTTMLPELTSELLIEAAKEMMLTSTEPSTTSQEITANLSQEMQPASKNNRLRQLFESEYKLKERYLKMMHLFPTVKDKESTQNTLSNFVKNNSRRKRSSVRMARQIPEAPTLPDLDYSILPPDVRRSLSADKLSPQSSSSQPQQELKEDGYAQQANLFGSISSEGVTTRDEGLRGVDTMADGVVNMNNNRVRTYGMNLANDHGYVWNNLWSNPGMNFSIGELETVDESGEESQGDEPNVPEIAPLAVVNEEAVSTGGDPASESFVQPAASEEDISDIYVNGEKEATYEQIASLNPEVTDKSEEPLNNDNFDADKVPETLSDLMSNRRFLNWLTDWTSVYMDLMVKHISEIVKEEVSKLHKVILANSPSNLDNKLSEAVGAATAEINLKPEEPKDIASSATDAATIKPEEEKISDADDVTSVFVDGEPSPGSLSDPDNLETFMRRNKHEKNEPNDKEVKISAENIFGNAFGSEKVTNLFFFFVKDKNNTLGDIIKPPVNSDADVLIEERIKVPIVETNTENLPVPQEVTEIPKEIEDAKEIESNLEGDKTLEIRPTLEVTENEKVIENKEIGSEVSAIVEHPAVDAEIKEGNLEAEPVDVPKIQESGSVTENTDKDSIAIQPNNALSSHVQPLPEPVAERIEPEPAIIQENQEDAKENEPIVQENKDVETTSTTESIANAEKQPASDDTKPEIVIKEPSDTTIEKEVIGDNVAL